MKYFILNIPPPRACRARYRRKYLFLQGVRPYTIKMKTILLFALFCVGFLPLGAFAQPMTGKAGEITMRPICGAIINRSTVNIQGTISTMKQTLPDGSMEAHTENFKLRPTEKKDVCAQGPFFEGQRLELTIRTLFPLFSCYTQINGNVFLDMKEGADGFKHYSATCR